ncbi:MAG: GAF domain-containing SpoIIE family protein phosphatase [Anaerolineae bacterium]
MNLIHMPYAFEYGKRWAHDPIPLPEYGFIAHVFRTGKTLVLNENVTKAFEEYGGHILTGPTKESGLQGPFTLRVGNLVVSDLYIEKSSVHVPLVSGGQTRGVIALENMEREHAFSESDVRLLETLASSMSIALENARLWEQEKLFLKALQRELEIGREIQAGFLPDTLPQAEGWEITALLMSAREVAGDFYDVFELSDGNIGLVIADVCDKGVGAALFMTLFRSLVRVIANQEYFEKVKDSRQTHSIQERLIHTMNLTNNYIAETHEKSGMFATLFFGILNLQDGTLTYINGGHEPPLILQAGKIRESLIKTGPAVGVMINSNFETGEIQLISGDIFFAFTDGVPDCMDPHGEFFGHQRIYDAFQTNCESAHMLIEHLRYELDRHIRDADQFDDITLLAVQRK